MKTLSRLIIVGLTLWPLLVSAQDEEPEQKWYEVELIVFTRNDADANDEEKWPLDPGHPTLQNTAELLPPTDLILDQSEHENLPPLFEMLGDEMLQLNDVAKTLDASSEYTVVIHRGWLQPVQRNKEPTPVFLEDHDRAYLYQETPEGSAPDIPEKQLLQDILAEDQAKNGDAATDPAPTVDPVALPMGPPDHRLYGTAKLTLTRFLHLAVDMVYRDAPPPSPDAGEALSQSEPPFPMLGADQADAIEQPVPTVFTRDQAQVLEGYRLHDSRRIRTQNLHYFDHPKFGVIAHVLPIEAPMVDGKLQLN